VRHPQPSIASTAEGHTARTAIAIWILLLLVLSVPTLVVAFEGAVHFDGLAIDGPFQLYNALRRIQAGYRPGLDFQFFHGMGVPYVHYWLYRLLGGGLNGSELARQLLGTTVYTIVFLVFFRAFSPNWTRAICLATAALAVSWLLKLSAVMFASIGMLGLRSALPTLLPVALYLPATRGRRMVTVGALLGAALLMGTEQGIAALLAYVIVMVVACIREPRRGPRLRELAGTIGVAGATIVVCLVAVGGIAGMRSVLRFNLSTVPNDQYWYFGVPPNLFISTWAGFATLFQVRAVGIGLLAGIGMSIWYLRRVWISAPTDETEASRRDQALATLPIYGLVSCGSLLGSLNIAYAHPLFRVLLIVALIELARLTSELGASRGSLLGVPRAWAIGVVTASLLAVILVPTIPASLTVIGAHVMRDHVVRREWLRPEGIWPRTLAEGQAVIDAHRSASGAAPVLWSTYAGWIEARNNLFNPAADYIIHALGPDNRRAYVETFRSAKPTLVQTVVPGYTAYEPWIENNNWAFYDELLRWYSISSSTAWSIFWERRSAPAPDPQAIGSVVVPVGATEVRLPGIPDSLASSPTVLDVDIEYDARNPWRWLPLIGSSPRYLVGLEGAVRTLPVSLDPYVRREQFPVIADPRRPVTLHFATLSLLPAAVLMPHRVSVAVRRIDASNRLWLQRLTR
jgi:hypothetical protein